MTLVIQRSEHRDTQAIHAKLDDLLRANDKAQTDLAKIDSQEPEEIEEYRDQTNHDLCRPKFCDATSRAWFACRREHRSPERELQKGGFCV
jgi:low affinity Fe/Cu permease